jgi:hypothetical protein
MGFDSSIFINCPFDSNYIDDLLKPMLFIIVKNGFTPRLSLELSDSGEIRLQKITEIIKSCKFSIHDLSLVKSKEIGEFARMNMPFELGIDFGLRKSGLQEFANKKFLILEADKYDYMKAISDINGFDIKVHSNSSKKIFECVYSWFSETVKKHKQDPPLKMYYEFMDFNASLYDEKLEEFKSEAIARNYISKISIPEYIQEIIERI